jgi:hypothetical protein
MKYIQNNVLIIIISYKMNNVTKVFSTRRKVAGSRLDEVIFFLSIYLILPAALGQGVHSASNRNEY